MDILDEETVGEDSKVPTKKKRWQTRFELSSIYKYAPNPQTIYLYAETLEALLIDVRFHLLRKKPLYISNIGDHIVGRMIYFYIDGRTQSPFFSEHDSRGHQEGWWCKRERMAGGRTVSTFEEVPLHLESFDNVVQHFTRYAIIPERGPAYQSRAIVGDDLRLPLLEKVLREGDEHPINDLIQRGWHIVALEYQGEVSINGELMNRKAIFVMGHPEMQAANITFNANYYKEL